MSYLQYRKINDNSKTACLSDQISQVIQGQKHNLNKEDALFIAVAWIRASGSRFDKFSNGPLYYLTIYWKLQKEIDHNLPVGRVKSDACVAGGISFWILGGFWPSFYCHNTIGQMLLLNYQLGDCISATNWSYCILYFTIIVPPDVVLNMTSSLLTITKCPNLHAFWHILCTRARAHAWYIIFEVIKTAHMCMKDVCEGPQQEWEATANKAG